MVVLRKVAAVVLGSQGPVTGLLVGRPSAAAVVSIRSLVAAETDWSNHSVADRTAGMDPWLRRS